MGIFNFIADIFGRGQTEAYKDYSQPVTYEPPPVRKPKSAISKGRMRVGYCIGDLPSEPGLYRHINKETGKVDYVGQTNNIRRRNQQHRYDGRLDLSKHKIAYSTSRLDASRDDLCDTEKKHIKKHSPTGNKYKGGNGRR